MTAGEGPSNPNEKLVIPKWINVDFFEKVLKKDEPNYVEVVDFKPVAALPPGENFTSTLVRVHMDVKLKDGITKPKSYILKTVLEGDKGGQLIDEFGLFPKELKMYQTYLPAFEALYSSAGQNIQLAPKCLHIEQKEGQINFIFEDLRVRNFQNVNRLTGFNMAQMKRVLRKLAEFHAASAVYAEQNGPFPSEFNESFTRNSQSGYEILKTMYTTRIDILKKAIPLWDLEDADAYIKKLPTLEQYWKCSTRTLDVDSNSFNVLTHGDLWTSNILLNFLPNGDVDQLLLLDHQCSKWGSPAEDLLFFITLSAAKDIRIKEFDHFVEIYHEHLIKCLKLLKYKKPLPKLRDLHKATYQENTSFYAFFAVFNHLIVIYLPTAQDSNTHNLMRDDEVGDKFRMRGFTSPIFIEAMQDIFPFFHHRGLFNFDDFDA